ncbi:GNAT family N-acetyltransferase [Streptomyces boninensis]|uniref:GNAT family N-acetyltransferase n=1 Tax=Streptomyces boninensis TaxID=2039455 RepID=UPI003B20D996
MATATAARTAVRTELVSGLQERAARALPAERLQVVDGWWLREAPGCSWWLESVLPHADHGPAGLARLVAAAEQHAAVRGRAACFQVTPGVCPDALDGLLAERGYGLESAASLRVAPAARVRDWGVFPPARPLLRAAWGRAGSPSESAEGWAGSPAEPAEAWAGGSCGAALDVRVDARPHQAWFDAWAQVSGRGCDAAAEWALLERIEQPTGYASVLLDGQVAAVGRAVADGGWAGLFGIATLPHARRRGAGRVLLGALAGWAQDAGAADLYLQVQRANAPALRLYDSAGFSEAAAYHYRRAAH